ncbi:glycosyltransferase [Candidatus Peribacteria bacterium]|nr:glycosyltransferase [Candidatus Peribacteria bacterium]
MRLTVLVPAYNEQESIGGVLRSIPKRMDPDTIVEVVVIDDGSTDATSAIALKHGATVVAHRKRCGLAEAFRTGLSVALARNADLIATLDADSQYRGEELTLLLKRMRETSADLVVGDRQVRKLQHMPWKHRIGNMVGSFMLRLLRCTTVTDASSGFRLFTARFGRLLRIRSIHTYTHEMLIQAKSYGLSVAEIPVSFLPRAHGKSKLVRTLRHHILRSCGTIVRAYLRRQPHSGVKHVLFITRSLQPGSGGMQLYAKTLLNGLKHRSDVVVVIVGYTGSKIGLPFFLLRAWFLALFTRARYVHFGDSVCALFLPVFRFLRPDLRLSVTVYGLDLTYPNVCYQYCLRHTLHHAHRVAAISHETAQRARERGVRKENIVVVPCAVPSSALISACQQTGSRSSFAPHILLLGRQIKRKGTAWFLTKVFPELRRTVLDLRVTIAGDGPELSSIQTIVSDAKFEESVTVLGAVSEVEKENLFCSSTLFLMPNIPVNGDMEGFGLTCIEATSRGLPVVAAKLEGLRDAVIESETGLFFEAENAEDCVRVIKEALAKKWHSEAIKTACRQKFSVDSFINSYCTDVWL